ncbi:MAG: ABC transporter permease [Anaerolineae bacterium]|nr:ABC transporter permease [Anaerolineae bacterium]
MSDILATLSLIGLSNGSVIALNAIALTLIYSAARTLNLAHGDVFALSSVVTMTILRAALAMPGVTPLGVVGLCILAGIATMAFGAALSALVEMIGFRPFRGGSRLAPVIATLGISFMLYQVALIWQKLLPTYSSGDHRSVPGVPEVPIVGIPALLPDANLLDLIGIHGVGSIQARDVLLLVVAVLVAFGTREMLRRTRIGRAIRACAQDPIAAQMVGINYNGTIRAAFVIGGILAGIGAFTFTLAKTVPVGAHGAESGLTAFTAAILGGIGNPVGALLAALMLGIFSAMTTYFFDAQWTPVFVYLLLVGLLMWRPHGLTAEDRSNDLTAPPNEVVVVDRRSILRRQPKVLLLAMLAGLILYPALAASEPYRLPVATGFLIWIMLTLGLTIVVGMAGVLDIGFAGNFAVGAYVAAYLTGPAMPWRAALFPTVPDGIVVVAIAGLVTGAVGVVRGLLTARMRSDYLAISTLALGLVVHDIIKYTSGVGGISAIPAPRLFGNPITSPLAQYAIAGIGVVIVVVLAIRLQNSRAGRALAAIREDEHAAASSGVDVARYRTAAFFIGSAIAGVAGALYASMLSYVDPDLSGFHISVMALAMACIGGAGSAAGAVLGALAILGIDRIAIPALAATLEDSAYRGFSIRELNYLVFGLALYLSLLGWRRQASGVAGRADREPWDVDQLLSLRWWAGMPHQLGLGFGRMRVAMSHAGTRTRDYLDRNVFDDGGDDA